jgi:hypothetical protein
MHKRVAVRPDWLKASAVLDIYSLSNCISDTFADYINFWKHNGYWLFNSPEVIEEIAVSEEVELSGTTLFYYEVYEYEFDEQSNDWSSFTPEPSFETNVRVPTDKQLAGYDVATFHAHTSPECSPLSCNSVATEIPVNKHCLFNRLEEAKEAIERGLFKRSEPGPYRIFAVYRVKSSLTNHPTGPVRKTAQAG